MTAARPGARFLLLAPQHPDREGDDWVRYLEELFRPGFALVRSADTVFGLHPGGSDMPERIGSALWLVVR